MGKKLIDLKSGLGRNLAGFLIFILSILVHVFVNYGLRTTTDIGIGTTEYAAIANNISSGHGFVMVPGEEFILWRPPFYIYLVAFFNKYFTHPFGAVFFLQIILNALTCVLIYKIGEKIFDRRVGFFAALILTCYPLFIINSIRLMPEAVFTFLLSLFLFFFIGFFEKSGWKRVVILGILLGLSTLTKASIQFLPFFLGLYAVLWLRKRIQLVPVLIRLIGVIIIMIGVISPWTIRNYLFSNELIFVDTSGGYTFWIGNRIQSDGHDDDPLTKTEMDEVKKDVARILGMDYTPSFTLAKTAWASGENSKKLYQEGLRTIWNHPLQVGWISLKKIYRFWFLYVGKMGFRLQELIWVIQGILISIGLIGIGFSLKQRKAISPLILIIAYFVLLHMMSTANIRYSMPVMPYMILLTVFGVSQSRKYVLEKACEKKN